MIEGFSSYTDCPIYELRKYIHQISSITKTYTEVDIIITNSWVISLNN